MKHYAQQGGRLSPDCRVKALEAGQWQCSDGAFLKLRTMPDGHLVNALLKHLASATNEYTATQYRVVAELLAAEVARRNLQDYALAVAAERDGRTR
jgi:hypothetical protein